MPSLWDQRTNAMQKAIRRRDDATAKVDFRERFLQEAETELLEAHAVFLEARERLYADFPELDRSPADERSVKVLCGDPKGFRHAFDIEQVETSNLPLCRISEFAGHLGPCVKEKSDA